MTILQVRDFESVGIRTHDLPCVKPARAPNASFIVPSTHCHTLREYKQTTTAHHVSSLCRLFHIPEYSPLVVFPPCAPLPGGSGTNCGHSATSRLAGHLFFRTSVIKKRFMFNAFPIFPSHFISCIYLFLRGPFQYSPSILFCMCQTSAMWLCGDEGLLGFYSLTTSKATVDRTPPGDRELALMGVK